MLPAPVMSMTRRSRPSAMPPCGGAPKLKAFSKCAELHLLLLGVHTEHLEQLRLQIALVDADAAAAEFDAVEHDIVRDRADLGEFAGLERGHVLGLRAREGMMHGDPVVVLGRKCEQREIDDPQEVERIAGGLDEPEQFRAAQAHAAEHFADGFQLRVRAEEEHVALGEAHALRERLLLGVAEKFHDGRFPFAARRST